MYWSEYVPVAVRKSQAQKKMQELKKNGKKVEPVHIQGRKIAKKFWGEKWCKHIESFSDYSNRLPRGRTYVCNGSVCHLGIEKGKVEAIVSGSSLYTVKVNIATLSSHRWQSIKDKCKGQISSLLELLKGQLSDHLMKIVADHKEGLFPQHGEIKFSCSCPDWASMCKHVAAVLYGIGSRLDEQPEKLFLLRGVDASELIAANVNTTSSKTDDLLEDEALSDIFGIEFDGEAEALPKSTEKKPLPAKKPKRTAAKKPSLDPTKMKGKDLQKFRLDKKLTVAEFADQLQVTAASIYRWEKETKVLNLQDRCVNAIRALLENAK